MLCEAAAVLFRGGLRYDRNGFPGIAADRHDLGDIALLITGAEVAREVATESIAQRRLLTLPGVTGTDEARFEDFAPGVQVRTYVEGRL
jgi:hypothetical protein